MASEGTVRRAKRLMTPRTWDTPDAKGFKEYAKQHYLQMMDVAIELAVPEQAALVGFPAIVSAFFEKLAAPLVYLYESWEVLSPEEKAKYSPELAKIHEESKAMVEKALPAVAPGVPMVKPEEAAKVPELDLGEIDALPWTSYLKTPKAKEVTIFEWAQWAAKQLEGHQREIAQLRNELTLLKRKLEPLYAAYLASRILQVLREEGRPRSRCWIWRMFGCDAWDALKHLEARGMVVVTRSGSHTMYSAKES